MATVVSAAGETNATGAIAVPFELRNDFARIASTASRRPAPCGCSTTISQSAAASACCRRPSADLAQPLLSPLYYISRALQPFADLVEAEQPGSVPRRFRELLEQKPAVIVMADVGTMPEAARARSEWVENGGTLVRFAGPRLAAAGNDEQLLPVRLRLGERSLGGALSWTEPQPVADFPQSGPFADLAPPDRRHGQRDRFWPNRPRSGRADLGQPCRRHAAGHWRPAWQGNGGAVSRNAAGDLVEPADFGQLSSKCCGASCSCREGRVPAAGERARAQGGSERWPPYRMLDANGVLVPAAPDARPLEATSAAAGAVTIENPPGLYGGETACSPRKHCGRRYRFCAIVPPPVGAYR